MAEMRNRARRYALPLPLSYRSTTASEWVPGTARNISDSGILFAADHALDIGALIDIEVAMEAEGERWPSKLVAHACVVRVVRDPSSAPAIAAKFLDHQLLPRRLEQA